MPVRCLLDHPVVVDLLVLAQTGADGAVDGAADGGQTAPAAGPPGGIFLPLIAIFLIFYFLIIRPEGKRRREREKKVKQIQKGDDVVTNGGIKGTVQKVDDMEVVLEVDKKNKVRIAFMKTAILDVLAPLDASARGASGTEGLATDESQQPAAQEQSS